MFAASFFPSAFYAPDYFPEHGAAPSTLGFALFGNPPACIIVRTA